MTRWEARSVVGFAVQAGWSGDELLDAVAAAWGFSGGESNTYRGATMSAAPQWWGLWGLPLGPHPTPPAYAAALDPARNAVLAHSLWMRTGKVWWLPTLAPAARDAARRVAALAVTAGPGVTVLGVGTAPPPTPGDADAAATVASSGAYHGAQLAAIAADTIRGR